jgi:hypothetical protein
MKTVKLKGEIIFVFKTSIKYKKDIVKIKKTLETKDLIISFDLEDCDKIMRIEGNYYSSKQIIKKIEELGYHCEELQ